LHAARAVRRCRMGGTGRRCCSRQEGSIRYAGQIAKDVATAARCNVHQPDTSDDAERHDRMTRYAKRRVRPAHRSLPPYRKRSRHGSVDAQTSAFSQGEPPATQRCMSSRSVVNVATFVAQHVANAKITHAHDATESDADAAAPPPASAPLFCARSPYRRYAPRCAPGARAARCA